VNSIDILSATSGLITAAQVINGPVGAVGAPTYSFTGATTSGMYYSSSTVAIAIGGTAELTVAAAYTQFGGELRVPDGTNGSPGYTFQDDQDSGLYRKGTNNITLAVNAADVVDVTTSGADITGALTVTTDIYRTAWTDYYSSSTITGWSASTGVIYYKRIGKTMIVSFYITGTSNAATAKFTLPVGSTNLMSGQWSGTVKCTDNGSAATAPGMWRLSASSSTVDMVKVWNENPSTGDFTASGTKSMLGTVIYETQ